MSAKKAQTPELTKGQKKKIVAILLIIWIVALPTLYYYLFLTGEQPQNQYKGWFVSIGDTATYEVFVNSNATMFTIADEIASKYHFSEILKHKDILGVSETTVRVTALNNLQNITKLAELILSFKGPAEVAQKLNNTWENKTKNVLPFFIPIGFWNELNVSFTKILPANSTVSYTHSWTNEYNYHFQYTMNDTKVYLFLSWGENDGILQAMTLNVTKHSTTDSISLILSGSSIARENTMENVIRNSIGIFLSFLVFLIVFGPPASIWVLVGSRTKYVTVEEKQTLAKKYADVFYTFDEIKRSVKIALTFVSFLSGLLGFVSFYYLTSILYLIEHKKQLSFFILSTISLPFVIAILIELYITMRFKDIDKKPELQSVIPFAAFFVGLGDSFLLLLSVYSLDFLSSVLAMGIVIIGEIFLLVRTVGWIDKRLDEIKQEIKSSLSIT